MAPRPQKEAATLAAAGHDVTVRGFWFDSPMVERDRALVSGKNWRFEPVVDFRAASSGGRLTNFLIRGERRVAREAFLRFKHFSPSLLGYGARAMLRTALRTKADLTIVHSEAGLWVGSRLLDKGFRVGVDFEDWFSEDLLPEARVERPILVLKHLEKRLARECPYRLTTSHAMADALATTYHAPKPTVVYNTFPPDEIETASHAPRDKRDAKVKSLHWFSQTIGQGRGLELLFAALKHITIPVEIHLRGNYSSATREWIGHAVAPEWRERVFMHESVPNAELPARIAEHDIGLALEIPYCLNKQLTVSNKLFQYLGAGLAVIATATTGQKEVLSKCPAAGKLIEPDDPVALARAVHELLADEAALTTAKTAAKQGADAFFAWEEQAASLLRAAEVALVEGDAERLGTGDIAQPARMN